MGKITKLIIVDNYGDSFETEVQRNIDAGWQPYRKINYLIIGQYFKDTRMSMMMIKREASPEFRQAEIHLEELREQMVPRWEVDK